MSLKGTQTRTSLLPLPLSHLLGFLFGFILGWKKGFITHNHDVDLDPFIMAYYECSQM